MVVVGKRWNEWKYTKKNLMKIRTGEWKNSNYNNFSFTFLLFSRIVCLFPGVWLSGTTFNIKVKDLLLILTTRRKRKEREGIELLILHIILTLAIVSHNFFFAFIHHAEGDFINSNTQTWNLIVFFCPRRNFSLRSLCVHAWWLFSE